MQDGEVGFMRQIMGSNGTHTHDSLPCLNNSVHWRFQKFFFGWSIKNLEKLLTDRQRTRGAKNYTKPNKKKTSYIDKKKCIENFIIFFMSFHI